METVYDSSEHSVNTSDTMLTVRRPKAGNGFFRLGDVAFRTGTRPNKALLVKPAGPDILTPPVNYTENWRDLSPEGQVYAGSSSWIPIPPPGYVCLGHVWTLNHERPPLDLIRCVNKKYVVPNARPSAAVWTDEGSADSPGTM